MNRAAIHTRDMSLIALFAVVIAICAWISIPTTIPFTMQTFGVFLSLCVLGGKRGTITICLYLLMGIAGIPVYAGGTSGIGVILGSTGGYMMGWILAGLLTWLIEALPIKRTLALMLSMSLGLLICYITGTAWFMLVYTGDAGQTGLQSAIMWCVVPYFIPDFIKIALALMINKRLTPHIS